MSERTKWAVLPGWRDTFLEEGWLALAPHMILPERDEDGRLDYCHLELWDYDDGQWFPTWAEAMRYADEQARTITVTLPRVGTSHTIPADITPDPDIHITRESAPHATRLCASKAETPSYDWARANANPSPSHSSPTHDERRPHDR